jgi:hypothetical protein
LAIEDANSKAIPAETVALPVDKLGNLTEDSFNYASIVGMLQYFQVLTRPDITFAVSQRSRHIHRNTNMHLAALQIIGRYLLKSSEKEIILQPTLKPIIDCYIDANFSGLWKLGRP